MILESAVIRRGGRRCRSVAWILSGLVLAVGVAGCAGQREYEAGQRFLSAGEYDQAVGAFRQAVAKDPKRQRYQLTLSDAEAMAAEHHLADAEALLDENRVTEAKAALRKAVALMPAHPVVLQTRRVVEARLDDCEAWLAEARVAIKDGDTARAVEVIEAAWAIDRSHPEVIHWRAELAIGMPGDVEFEASPHPQRPAASRARQPVLMDPYAAPEHLYRGTVSRRDKRYPKMTATTDGIVVKAKGTCGDPLLADIEVRVGGARHRYRQCRVGERIDIRGTSGRPHALVIIGINHYTGTIHFDVVDAREVDG